MYQKLNQIVEYVIQKYMIYNSENDEEKRLICTVIANESFSIKERPKIYTKLSIVKMVVVGFEPRQLSNKQVIYLSTKLLQEVILTRM